MRSPAVAGPKRDPRSVPVSSLRRLIVSVAILARDQRIPKPLRGAAAIGMLPLPGPLDELILLLVAIPLVLFYRRSVRDAWQRAGATVALRAARPYKPDDLASRGTSGP